MIEETTLNISDVSGIAVSGYLPPRAMAKAVKSTALAEISDTSIIR